MPRFEPGTSPVASRRAMTTCLTEVKKCNQYRSIKKGLNCEWRKKYAKNDFDKKNDFDIKILFSPSLR